MTTGTSHSERARKFGRFVVVGLLNTAFGYSVYALLLWLGMSAQPALVIAFSIGVLWNYMTTARLVFRVSDNRRLPAYIVSYLVIYLANALALEAALAWGADPFLAQAVLTPFFAVISFILLSWVFRGQSRPA